MAWCDDQVDARLNDISVFHVPANDLAALLAGSPVEREVDSFQVPDLDLALWRPVLPSDYSQDPPDDEYRCGRCWQTLRIGAGRVLAGVAATPPGRLPCGGRRAVPLTKPVA